MIRGLLRMAAAIVIGVTAAIAFSLTTDEILLFSGGVLLGCLAAIIDDMVLALSKRQIKADVKPKKLKVD